MNQRRGLVLMMVLALVGGFPSQGRGQTWTPPDPALVEQARAILADVPLIDGHNDLPSHVLEDAGGRLDSMDIASPQPELMTDLPRMRAGRLGAQFWSAYVDVDSVATGAALRQGLREVDMVHRMVARYPDLELALTADDIVRIHKAGQIASLIGLEGGHAIENSLAALRMFYALGVRYMTLTHSATTDWADAATDRARHGGLTPFGVDVIHEMNRIGMFVDLSHVSEGTMNDALDVSSAPVIFSHSSARALVPAPRDVPDDVLRRVPENGGVVMVTFVPGFVSKAVMDWENARTAESDSLRAAGMIGDDLAAAMDGWAKTHPRPRATVADVADHIDHIRQVAGIDYIGIGSDFDGISSTPLGLEDVGDFPMLFAELLRRGYSEEDLRKIAGENLLRAMHQMEAVARQEQAAQH
ncbi:MAG: dipeptidase [Gemmatimonadota bacterium]|jgi:membrane dipeptidase